MLPDQENLGVGQASSAMDTVHYIIAGGEK